MSLGNLVQRDVNHLKLSLIRHITDADLSSLPLIIRLKLWHATALIQCMVFGDWKMKRSLIALSVAAAVLAPAAEAAPKVYGKINITAESYEKDPATGAKTNQTVVNSNASRFGLKGEDELTATLSAVYQIEWEVSLDNASTVATSTTAANIKAGTDLKPRNRYLGLKSSEYGTVKIGQYDSYMKLAEGKVDLFNDYALGDIEFTVAGQDRVTDVIGYESPKFSGFQVNTMVQGNDATSRGGSSSSVTFADEEMGLYAAVAYNKGLVGKSAIGAKLDRDAMRAVVSYKLGDVTLAGLYHTAENTVDGKEEEQGYLVSGAYAIDDENTFKVQYSAGERDDKAIAGIADRTMLSVGVDHHFTKKTKVFAFYTTRDEELKDVTKNYEESSIAVGMEHSF